MQVNMNSLRKQAINSYNNLVQYFSDYSSDFYIQQIQKDMNNLGQILGILCCISEEGNELFTEIEDEIKFLNKDNNNE